MARKSRRQLQRGSGWVNDTLACGLRVEQAVRLVRVFEPPVMRKQVIDVDAAIGDEARALRLADRRERPRADQRHLPAQQVVTDVEGHVTALADKARLAPGAYASHRLRTCQRRRGCVER